MTWSERFFAAFSATVAASLVAGGVFLMLPPTTLAFVSWGIFDFVAAFYMLREERAMYHSWRGSWRVS